VVAPRPGEHMSVHLTNGPADGHRARFTGSRCGECLRTKRGRNRVLLGLRGGEAHGGMLNINPMKKPRNRHETR
jgi:hypothetical protein